MVEDNDKTYSIALRLRRIVHEDVYVTVFVDDTITKENEDGTLGIDWDKFVAAAMKTSAHPDADWQRESANLEVHPVQQPMPEGRSSVDSVRNAH